MLLYIVDIMVCSLMVNEIEDKYRFKIIECLQSLIFPGITFYEFQSIFIRKEFLFFSFFVFHFNYILMKDN